jgi:NAD-dependent SIR2 family protein deacetylase
MATKELQNVAKKKLVVLSGAGISADSKFYGFSVNEQTPRFCRRI